ncbi:NEDD8-activating enzyme E1 regulatory subunit [Diutina catenulata]
MESERYDRQLRLWATTGQSKLEKSHVCVVNPGATGVEILKNLVLPGVGQYTIVDPSKVTPASLGGNFFLNDADIGLNTAAALAANLTPLNPQVKGHAVVSEPQELPEEFWAAFDCVVVCGYVKGADGIKQMCWSHGIPFYFVNTMGFYGSVHFVCPEVTVIDTHAPSRLFDLRVDQPWPELQAYVDSIDLDALDDIDHAHVPSVVIYIKALQQWYATHGGPPQSYAEKQAFRKAMEGMGRGGETNFDEAGASYHRALQKTAVPSNITELFNHKPSKTLFWRLVEALKRFVDSEGVLPLAGNLPDMTSDTASYITLSRIYHDKAKRDVARFTELIEGEPIAPEIIKLFCKNAPQLHVATGSPERFGSLNVSTPSESSTENSNLLAAYFGMVCFQMFLEQTGRNPTAEELVNVFTSTTGQKSSPAVATTFAELVSHSTSHYHNMNALMGGVVSQEVLKIATAQYTPLDNLFVFDGVRSMSDKWKIV